MVTDSWERKKEKKKNIAMQQAGLRSICLKKELLLMEKYTQLKDISLWLSDDNIEAKQRPSQRVHKIVFFFCFFFYYFTKGACMTRDYLPLYNITQHMYHIWYDIDQDYQDRSIVLRVNHLNIDQY